MPKRSSIRRRPKDANQLAKLIIEIASGEASDPLMTADGKSAAAVLLGRQGGLKGGAARALRLSPTTRSEIAKKAAAARWERTKKYD